MKTYQHYIGGQYVDPIGGKWFDSMDPYRGAAWAKTMLSPRQALKAR